ncbi:hypothetical protein AMELA_G00277590 [Ameiurus melas]|uniref:Uncharacterized protein n=1 Tax=Ameiurus melas TaxID=219545 RepID=A0A7J5ZLW3_AMEME|nr:hypothetical protein AMELA_G00277590 [Ameiurus melas]
MVSAECRWVYGGSFPVIGNVGDDVLVNVSTLIGEWFIRLPISRGGPRRAVAGKHNHLPWSDLTEGEGVSG